MNPSSSTSFGFPAAKPPTKASISIEAVQSSLYFLHVERAEDEELRKSLEATKAAECRNKENVSIQRKPLPPTPYANHPASQRPPTPPKSYPHYQPALSGTQMSTQADRYAARGTHLRLKTSEATNHSGIPRKPVSARLMRSPAQPSPGTTPEEGGNALTPAGDAQMKFKLARKPVQSTSPADAYEPNRASMDNASLRASPVGQSRGSDPGFTSAEAGRSSRLLRITLIRRDPTSGSQWNVGSIIYPGPEPQGNPLREFEIELTSPGYVKFAPDQAKEQLFGFLPPNPFFLQQEIAPCLLLRVTVAGRVCIQQWCRRQKYSMSTHAAACEPVSTDDGS
ncbi:hypothetical protein KCU88_g1873, partial [Aureobasidium melanogenum]